MGNVPPECLPKHLDDRGYPDYEWYKPGGGVDMELAKRAIEILGHDSSRGSSSVASPLPRDPPPEKWTRAGMRSILLDFCRDAMGSVVAEANLAIDAYSRATRGVYAVTAMDGSRQYPAPLVFQRTGPMADAFAGIARSLCSLEDDGTKTRAVCLKQMGGGTTKKDDRLVEVVNVVSVPIETTTERTTTPSSAPWGHYCVVKAPPGSPKSSRRSSSSRPCRYWKNSSWLSSHRTKRIRSSFDT